MDIGFVILSQESVTSDVIAEVGNVNAKSGPSNFSAHIECGMEGRGRTRHHTVEEVEGLGRGLQLESLILQKRQWKLPASASKAPFEDDAILARLEQNGFVWGAMTLHYVQDNVFSPTIPLSPPEFDVLPCAKWLRMGRVSRFAKVLAFYRYKFYSSF